MQEKLPNKKSCSQSGHGFFSQPKRVASAAVAGFATVGLLIPAAIRLKSFSTSYRQAQSDQDDAENAYESTLSAFNQTKNQIQEAQQRVIDLNCAILGYPAYNQELMQFQQRIINSTLPIPDVLQTFWSLKLVPDQSLTSLDYERKEYKVDKIRTCSVDHCHKASDGMVVCEKRVFDCSYWQTYYYLQETTTIDTYTNILEGSGISFRLACGKYELRLQVSSPISYLVSEALSEIKGSEFSGLVCVTLNRAWGSQVPILRTLDDAMFDTNLLVSNTAPQSNAMVDIATQLFQLLSASIALFSATVSNYPALQISINGTISDLVVNATALNATLQTQLAIYEEKQALLEEADAQFSQGLALWLSLLFGVPTALTLLTYFFVERCKFSSPAPQAGHVAVISQDGIPVSRTSPEEHEMERIESQRIQYIA